MRFDGLSNKLITPVHVSVPFDPANPPDPLPMMQQVNALWDTGATHTAISAGVVKKLALTSVATGIVTHADGTSASDRHIINLGLPNKLLVAGVYVNELKLGPEFDVLIGMDIISQGDLALTHVGGKTLFSFRIPSIESVDFVQRVQNQKTLTRPSMGANEPCYCGSGKKFKKCHRNA